ncbi:galectin-1-like [Aquarana catesbeiana]|uniref:galectin-1-like n=1 Tax=Aquarana catesbeiana TaxID=8400 RepID=UPI003CC9B3EF
MADKIFSLYNFSLKPGHCVEVEGFIPKDCRRFFINLGTDEKNLVIHFDIRFDFQGEKSLIVLNSMKDGVYGEEQRETVSVFPFQDGSDTMVCFQFEEDKIIVQLPTGKPFSFPVRFLIEEISYLAIVNLQPISIRLK